jgi:hypothetical protein
VIPRPFLRAAVGCQIAAAAGVAFLPERLPAQAASDTAAVVEAVAAALRATPAAAHPGRPARPPGRSWRIYAQDVVTPRLATALGASTEPADAPPPCHGGTAATGAPPLTRAAMRFTTRDSAQLHLLDMCRPTEDGGRLDYSAEVFSLVRGAGAWTVTARRVALPPGSTPGAGPGATAAGVAAGAGPRTIVPLPARGPIDSLQYTPRTDSPKGREFVVVYVGMTGCGASRDPELREAVRRMKPMLARQAAARSVALTISGVALDWGTEKGVEYLRGLGAWDEISVGSNWTNLGAVHHIWAHPDRRAAVPQILVLERTVVEGPRRISVSDERRVAVLTGVGEIVDWVKGGSPLPADTAR